MFERLKEGLLVMLLGLAFTVTYLCCLALPGKGPEATAGYVCDLKSSAYMVVCGFTHIFVPMF